MSTNTVRYDTIRIRSNFHGFIRFSASLDMRAVSCAAPTAPNAGAVGSSSVNVDKGMQSGIHVGKTCYMCYAGI